MHLNTLPVPAPILLDEREAGRPPRSFQRARSLLLGLRRLRLTLRNPLEGLPPAIYHQPIVHAPILSRTIVHVADPTLIGEALVGNASRLDKGPSVRRPLTPALGEGLLTAEGAHWRWQRQALAPLFRPDRVASLAQPMLAAARLAVAELRAASGPVAIDATMARVTFHIIVDSMLSGGQDFDADVVARGVTDFVRQTNWSLVLLMLGLPEWIPHPGKSRAHTAVRAMQGAVSAVVERRRVEGPRPAPDLLDRLLAARDPETGRAMTDREVIDNLLTFLTAGHETTALSLAWTLDLLARHPAVAARAAAEVQEVTGGGAVAPEHLDRLPFLGQVIQEAMRLYPPVPMIARAVREPFELGGLQLHADTVVVVPVAALHRRPALWPEPDRFDPSRFDPAAKEARPRYAFMPFGAGPRICIGGGFAMLEATAILAVLLNELHFRPVGETPRARMDLTLRPDRPLLLHVGEGAASVCQQ